MNRDMIDIGSRWTSLEEEKTCQIHQNNALEEVDLRLRVLGAAGLSSGFASSHFDGCIGVVEMVELMELNGVDVLVVIVVLSKKICG